MTATAPDALTCPNCRSANTMRTADGNGLCFDCRTEWDPTTITALPSSHPRSDPEPSPTWTPYDGPSQVAQPTEAEAGAVEDLMSALETSLGNAKRAASETVDNILGAPIEARPADAATADAEFESEIAALTEQVNADAETLLDSLLGGTATLEGGQVGTVVAFVDDDTIAVQLGDGRVEHVRFADVESVVPAPTAATALTVDVDDETAAAIASADLSIAALILKAGIATIRDVNGTLQVGTPPEKYLDDDPEMFPIIERGAATAAAILILVCGVDVDALLRTIATWGTDAETS